MRRKRPSGALVRSGQLWAAIAVLWLASLLSIPAQAQDKSTRSPPAPSAAASAVPPPEVLLVLVRTTLIALDQANKTGSYAVLRALGGSGLQAITETQLSSMFAAMRTNRIDLSPAAVITPELSEVPSILPDGQLRLAGHFATQPLQIQFQFAYEHSGETWKPNGLAVSMVPVKTTASSPAPAPALPPPSAQPTDPAKKNSKRP